jgi:hypothetical protein
VLGLTDSKEKIDKVRQKIREKGSKSIITLRGTALVVTKGRTSSHFVKECHMSGLLNAAFLRIRFGKELNSDYAVQRAGSDRTNGLFWQTFCQQSL